jgi:hypothetical protein
LSNVLVAQLETNRVTAELWLNGLPLLRATESWSRKSRPVHQFLQPGPNRLELVVEPGPTPSTGRIPWGSKTLPEQAWAEARLLVFQHGSAPEPELGTMLGKLRFDGRTPSDGGPVEREHRFPAIASLDVHPGWSRQPVWAEAEPLRLEASVIEEAHATLEELARALRAGDRAGYETVAGSRVGGHLRAYPAMPVEMAERDVKELLTKCWEHPDYVVDHERATQDFRLVGGDRVLQTIGRDFTPAFKYRDADGVTFGDEMFLARIDGRFRVVA